jgi:hypothetical protein
MKATRGKLDEALFFLQQTETHYLENPTFDYYLSAFISSARSVLWVMRSEYNNTNGWENWYETRKPTEEEELLLKKINDIRVSSEKKRPLKTNFQVVFKIPKDYLTQELRNALEKLPRGKKIDVTVTTANDENKPLSTQVEKGRVEFRGKVDKVSRALGEPQEDDILEACKKYYTLLEQIVLDCEIRFG